VRASEVGEELKDKTRAMEREVIARSRELALANRELREANAKLGELDLAKTAFYSNVSHEFRTPLTLMLGPLEDALSDTTEEPSPRQRARLQLAHANALRLLKLVNALLDFSSLEAGRMLASFAPLDVAQYTAELAGMFQSAVDKAGIRLVIDCPLLSEPVWVDRDMWEKVVPNLISNAFKFTLEGEITVRVRERTTDVVLEVGDTGVGIPEAELPRIFERFQRVPGAIGRSHEGSGIGLSLVRELIQLHGGHMAVESMVGRGTKFFAHIPKGYSHLPAEAVAHVAADPATPRNSAAHAAEAVRWAGDVVAEAPPPEANGAGRERTGSARVLVVDDNADLREYIRALLSPAYDVTTASDGLAALAAVRAELPDLIVSDIMMPRLDGFGLVRELRANRATASVPVILLSARAGEEAAVQGLDAGSDDYLVKPFSARELLARVRTHVDLARTRQAWVSELERINRELDAFSYSVSHDLHAPLRAISGFSQALLQDCSADLGAEARGHIDRICSNVARMRALIDGLLELARVGREPVNDGIVDLSALARAAVADLQRAEPARVVSVQIEEGMVAHGDRGLLGAVVANLIGNAWKYTARRERARIEFGRQPVVEPTFFVRDNGAGFDMAYASKLFVPFQRLHAAHEFVGTGVGLATVQRVIARHGGRVWAEAKVDQGATFFFALPAGCKLA
jgi:signal transduction histidine kinase